MSDDEQPGPVKVIENLEGSRFDLTVDGDLAGFTVYQPEEDAYAFVHTEIDAAFEHRGLGSQLVRAALDTMLARSHPVLPFCPFVRAFIAEHEEYLVLVPVHARARFHLPAEA